MKLYARLLGLVLVLVAVPAHAETQAVGQLRLSNILQRHGFVGGDLVLVLKDMYGVPRFYDTAVNLLADTGQADGTLGYAVNTHALYVYENSTWEGVTVASGGNSSISGTLGVSGITTLTGELDANGGVDRTTTTTLAIGATQATSTHIGHTATPVTISSAGAVVIPSTTTATGAIYANGGVDVSSGAMTIGAANASSLAITPATTITGLTTATGGLTTTAPLFLYKSHRYCGLGSNAATAQYNGPVSTTKSFTADYTAGGTACIAAGQSSTTEATVYGPISALAAVKVVGMQCAIAAGGGTGIGTFKFRVTLADTSPAMSCTVTNDGANAKSCTVILAAPVTVAANANTDIKVTWGTDNMVAVGDECNVFYTF